MGAPDPLEIRPLSISGSTEASHRATPIFKMHFKYKLAFRCVFGTILNPNMSQTSLQNRPRKASKTLLEPGRRRNSFPKPFLIFVRPRWATNDSKKRWFLHNVRCFRACSKLPYKDAKREPKKHSKTAPGPNWRPFEAHKHTKMLFENTGQKLKRSFEAALRKIHESP